MLLERERERLLAVLQSRTATHAERELARKTLEGELSPADWPDELWRARSAAPAAAASDREASAPAARRR